MSDLIRKEDVLTQARPEYLNPQQKRLASYNQGWNDALDEYVDRIEKITSVKQPDTEDAKLFEYQKIIAKEITDNAIKKSKWIPCSERLPEEFETYSSNTSYMNVLCCDKYGEMLIARPFECYNSDTGFSAENDECYMYNCVAWMPLPQPYGKESEVEE